MLTIYINNKACFAIIPSLAWEEKKEMILEKRNIKKKHNDDKMHNNKDNKKGRKDKKVLQWRRNRNIQKKCRCSEVIIDERT